MTAATFITGALEMGSTSTLTSLAMLKIEIDHGSDYLNYLKPFVLQALFERRPEVINDGSVSNLIKEIFGLEIPSRTIHIILRRLVKDGHLYKEDGLFHIKKIDDPDITIQKKAAKRQIQNVTIGLVQYAKDIGHGELNEGSAVQAICSFLTEFDIPCLKAYLRGTAIPSVKNHKKSDIVLVSEYVIHIQQYDLARFECFITLLQGHMIANALLCPDLQGAPKTYKGITFYLDTPLLISAIKIDDEHKTKAIQETINLLKNLGARIATFSHSREELERVISGAANHIDDPKSKGSIVRFARTQSLTKSDLLLFSSRIDQALESAGIEVVETPRYIQDYQIDESAFELALDDEISYFNERAREYDINSVRSIYVLRGKSNPHSLEKCIAALVTSNSAFSRAAYAYGRSHGNSSDVSSVITDFSLANLAWLKAPMGAPEIPTAELLAYAYAAKKPTTRWLEKYLIEIEKLEKSNKISTRDHQLLRSSIYAQEELMKLTLGEESALQEESITQTLSRVTSEIKSEEIEKTEEERRQKVLALKQAETLKSTTEKIKERIYWDCKKKAENLTFLLNIFAISILAIGAASSIGVLTASEGSTYKSLFTTLAILTTALALYGLYDGFTIKKLTSLVEQRLLNRFLHNTHKKYLD